MLESDLIVNFGYLLMLGAFVARDVLWLRLLLVLGQSSVTYYALGLGDALPVAGWNALFAFINAVHAIVVIRERLGIALPEELRAFYEQTFAALSPREFLRLWRMGKVEYATDTPLIIEGERPRQLFFLLEGELKVARGGQELARLRQGRFFAEMSFLTGEPASADVHAQGRVRYLAWPNEQLHDWRRVRPTLWTKLLSALGKDLVDKIKAASVAH